MEKINFQDLPSTDTPIDATNLNLLQDNVENAINEVNYKGGELIAYGIIGSSGDGEAILANQTGTIASNNFPNKTADIVNYVDGVLTFDSGAFKVNKTSIAGLVEVETTISGNVQNITGIYFWENANELPSGVTFMKNYFGVIMNTNGIYGGASNTSLYKIETDIDTPFFANPGFIPQGGSFIPNNGGLSSYQTIKVYAKKRG